GLHVLRLEVEDAAGAVGAAEAALLVRDGAASPPVARAEPGGVASPGALVTLDGSRSRGAADFLWTQVGGPAVSLAAATSARPSFVAPGVPAVLAFTLTVRDTAGVPGTPVETQVIVPGGADAEAMVGAIEARGGPGARALD